MVLRHAGDRRLSLTVWAHHMFATGAVLLPFFSFMTFLIAVPDRAEVLQLDRHHVARLDHLRDADAVVARVPGDLPVRRPDRRHAGLAAARLPRHRHLLRGGALPLRAVRHHRVRRLRRDLLLVPEVHRPLPGRAAGQAALLADLHRLPHHVPGPALARQRGHAPPLRRLPARRRLHHPEHHLHASARSCSAPRCCRSSATSTSPTGSASSAPPTTRGATATRWSGRPPARRRGTTSPRCRGSAPSGRPSRRTTRTCSPRLEREAHGTVRHHRTVAMAGVAAVGAEGNKPRSQRDPDPGPGG